MRKTHHSRRTFCKESLKIMVAVIPLTSLVCACSPGEKKKKPAEIEVQGDKLILDLKHSVFRPLKTIGNGIKIEFADEPKPLIITRVSAGKVRAFSSQCTHAGFEVMLPEQGTLMCSSGHGAVFDLEGRVIKGPAKSPLTTFPATFQGNKVIITYN